MEFQYNSDVTRIIYWTLPGEALTYMHISSLTKVTLNVFPGKGEKGFNSFNGVKISVTRNSWPFQWNTEGTFRNYWDLFACAEESCLMCFRLKQLFLNFYFKLFLQSFLPFLLDSTAGCLCSISCKEWHPQKCHFFFHVWPHFSPDWEPCSVGPRSQALLVKEWKRFWHWLPLV